VSTDSTIKTVSAANRKRFEEIISNADGKWGPNDQESSSASIADRNARAGTDLFWQDHPSMLAQLPPWSLPAQKSAKAVFFEENAKGSPPK
jgi:hypothetical protein